MSKKSPVTTIKNNSKTVDIQAVRALLVAIPETVPFDSIPIKEDGRPDNSVLFRHFFSIQVRLVRQIVQLRFPFAHYLRNEISEAVADRECRRLGAEDGVVDMDPIIARSKSNNFPRALEMRHTLLGNHPEAQKDRIRVRTQMLRNIHGAIMKGADLLETLEEAYRDRKRNPRAYAEAEDLVVMWIINSLSCYALMEMVRLCSNEFKAMDEAIKANNGRPRGRGLQLLYRMRKTANECVFWRNSLVRANLFLAHRHAEVKTGSTDPDARRSQSMDGLLQAIDRYNALLPAPFEGFAPDWIRQAIKRGYQQQGSLISTPINVQNNAIKVRDFMDACQNRAGIGRERVTPEMLLKGFAFKNSTTGKKEIIEGVRDAADGRKISADALKKAMASPILRSLDAPIGDNGEGDSAYPQIPSEEPDAATYHGDHEHRSRFEKIVRRHTTAAERVVLGFMADWSDPSVLAGEYIDDLIAQSVASTRRQVTLAETTNRNLAARLVAMRNFQPAPRAIQEKQVLAKAQGE